MASCGAPTNAGGSCSVSSGLSPTNGRCLFHDPDRRDEAAAARVRGETGRKPRAFRTVAPGLVPPLKSIDDAVAAAAWLFQLTCDGTIDPITCREANRSIATFKDAVNKRDLLQQIRELSKKLREYERREKRQ